MPSPTAASTGEDVVNEARSLIGTPYVWGGESRSGVDCSGFVWLVYGSVGREYTRCTTATFTGLTQFVETGTPEDGDVVLYTSHMGIYDGGKLISAHSGPRSRRVMTGPLNDFSVLRGYYHWVG